VKGRRVYMDFRANPSNAGNPTLQPFSFDILGEEARKYLANSNAFQATPIERLRHMNPLAIELYQEHGIDLWTEPLEVAVCAQHNNGGLKGNIWWESDLKHLFPVGEVNGSHGVYRPGGSALNSGQCGSLRAAQYIAARYQAEAPAANDFISAVQAQVETRLGQIAGLLQKGGSRATLEAYRNELQERMTKYGAHIRDREKIHFALQQARQQLAEWELTGVADPADLLYAFKNRDAMICEIVYLAAMEEYLKRQGVSRGSYMVMDAAGQLPCDGLGDDFRFVLGDDPLKENICEARLQPDGAVAFTWTDRRPIPQEEGWFENVWADYREDRVIR